jgi:hypothetical protein
MTSPQETSANQPDIPYGIFREVDGEIIETITDLVGAKLAPYQQPKIHTPGTSPDQISLMPVFIYDDFKSTDIKLPNNFLRVPYNQHTLRNEVPSLNNDRSVVIGSATLDLARRNYSIIELELASGDTKEAATECANVCLALARMLGAREFDVDQLIPRRQTIRVVQESRGSVPEEVLVDLKEEIDSKLSAEATLTGAQFPNSRSKTHKERGKDPSQAEPKGPQTREDLDRMLRATNLRPVKKFKPRRR